MRWPMESARRRPWRPMEARPMADLTTNFAGIRCPNPFWLASGPPTNCGDQVKRAFDAGWGGAVWKTIGEPIVNVSSRYSSVDWNGQRMMGFNNIELITDRPIEVNLRELAEVKKRYPRHAAIASLMVESKRQAWHDIVKRSEDAGADGLELNFGCPHGMSERGMGSAVGQVPEYACMITEWVKEAARTPVLVKLTPNITDIRMAARAARRGRADALSAINTINSITGIDLDTLTPRPNVGGLSSHGGYCGPPVKPIALHLVQQLASDPDVARINRDTCIGCDLCYIACWDGAHQCIHIDKPSEPAAITVTPVSKPETLRATGGPTPPARIPRVDEAECVGCNLCWLVCPVENCITMAKIETGRPVESWAQRTTA